MGKNLYVGIDGKSRKAKKIYIGIDGKARKVKKAWIGINGVARLFFSGGKALGYIGTTQSPLSSAKDKLAATSTEEYAFFAAGIGTNSVDAFRAQEGFVKYTPTEGLRANNTNARIRNFLGATSLNGYALFGGGTGNSGGMNDAAN